MPKNDIILHPVGVPDTKYAFGSHEKNENDPFDSPPEPHDVNYNDEDDPIPDMCHNLGDGLEDHIQMSKIDPFSGSDIEVETNNTFGTNENGENDPFFESKTNIRC